MPGFTTHYLFGVDAYKRITLDSIRRNLHRNHGAFALGLQGPDIFFYYLPSYFLHKQNLGALAHDKDTGAFFSYLLQSRSLFEGKPRSLAVADAYINGFIGHYTLDCIMHPYVYAFTNYHPVNPPKNYEYFGQHAYFETELDKDLLWIKKRMYPSQFHQNATIHLNPFQRKIIGKMLAYSYNHTYPGVFVTEQMIRGASHWMKAGTRLLNDPSGQKKVLLRLIEKFLFRRAFISPMLPSDQYQFIEDPMNYAHRKWIHPWTKEESTASFMELYQKAGILYSLRLKNYYRMVRNGFTDELQKTFAANYGNLSFLSGLPL